MDERLQFVASAVRTNAVWISTAGQPRRHGRPPLATSGFGASFSRTLVHA